MADKLIYPLINGFRHSFSSVKVKFQVESGEIEMFVKSIDYSRTRSVGFLEGNHPDPYGKTRGANAYKAGCEIALAEYRLLVAQLGKGYGDRLFSVLVTYGENGFETVTDELLACQFAGDEASMSSGSDALHRKIDLAPLKIFMGSFDDLDLPLASP